MQERTIRKRVTRQMAAVYDALRGDESHPSADEIYRRVRRKCARVSLGTVYRNLQKLSDEGKIRALILGDRVARYDPLVTEHDHFVCQACGRVQDLFLERDRRLDLTPLLEAGLQVSSHSLAIYGLCRGCNGRKKAAREKG